jgi:hypothetical protein
MNRRSGEGGRSHVVGTRSIAGWVAMGTGIARPGVGRDGNARWTPTAAPGGMRRGFERLAQAT